MSSYAQYSFNNPFFPHTSILTASFVVHHTTHLEIVQHSISVAQRYSGTPLHTKGLTITAGGNALLVTHLRQEHNERFWIFRVALLFCGVYFSRLNHFCYCSLSPQNLYCSLVMPPVQDI